MEGNQWKKYACEGRSFGSAQDDIEGVEYQIIIPV